MVRERHARVAVMPADKPPALLKPSWKKTGVADYDALQ
jgi:hypothetical protein